MGKGKRDIGILAVQDGFIAIAGRVEPVLPLPEM